VVVEQVDDVLASAAADRIGDEIGGEGPTLQRTASEHAADQVDICRRTAHEQLGQAFGERLARTPQQPIRSA
jgi:hypothetical protein